MRETPELRAELKKVMLANILACCRQRLTTECKVLK